MNRTEIFAGMRAKLPAELVPDVELEIKSALVEEILQLKKERNAIILAHNYMEPALYNSPIPDFRGDSLELSRRAALTEKDVIVFCGVRFMAETAKILNPHKMVLLPSEKAGCSLASSITAKDVLQLKEEFPGGPVVSYVNTYADVKAESDVCCTSGNASAVVEWAAREFGTEKVIFLPDEYLASNVAKETGKRIIFPTKGKIRIDNSGLQYEMVGWKGRCEVHEKFNVEDIQNIRAQFPDVLVLAHPECSPEVIAEADFSGSTTAMIRYVEKIQGRRILLLTECSMGDNIVASLPHLSEDMLRLCSVRCPHMNQITLEDTRNALLHNRYAIEIPEEIRVKAELSLKRMIAIG